MATHAYSTVAPEDGVHHRTRHPCRTAVAPLRAPVIPFRDATFPEVYAMKLAGDCLAPELLDGDEVVFTTAEPPVQGDFACLILRPELVQAGQHQSCIKRLALAIPPYVTFPWREHPKSEIASLVMVEQLNPPRQFLIRCDALLGVHKFVRVQRRAVRA